MIEPTAEQAAELPLAEERGLIDPRERVTWEERTEDARVDFIRDVQDSYFHLVTEFYDSANLSVQLSVEQSKGHRQRRRMVIILTGLVSIVSIVVAYVTAT